VILQAQANEGSRNSDVSAWAKNNVSVGGIRHFNTLTRADDQWNNAGSIGPADDGRVKPDLSFWYDSILTASSSGGYTTSFGGTSAATPTSAGHFGLMFEMWSAGIFGNAVDPGGTVFENRPHASTAKALMINTARPYDFSGAAHDLTRVHQGWGTANVENLYDSRERLFVIDETDVLPNLGSTTYELTVLADTPTLKATLVYLDPAGTTSSSQHRINDLTLELTSPSLVTYFGNNGLLEGNASVAGGSPNTIDTVENVWIQNPEAGVWSIEVRADEINQDSHVETVEIDADYALVVSGAFPGLFADGFESGDTLAWSSTAP
jgi:serine protease AprX